jgi:hypothetical protein
MGAKPESDSFVEQYDRDLDDFANVTDGASAFNLNTKFRNLDQHYDALDQVGGFDSDPDHFNKDWSECPDVP